MPPYNKTVWTTGNPPAVSAANLNKLEDGVKTAHTILDAGLSPHAASHASAGSDPVALTPTQITGTAVITTDPRLSDVRTPAAHQHAAVDLASGVIATARLGSGAASSTTYLRGDQTWGSPPGLYGDHLVVWNGSAWVYQGATVTVRPSIPSYVQGARVVWDTSIYPAITTFPALAIQGDGWRPHGDVAIALLGG